MSAPRVVILDSGMRGRSGHNFAYTTAVRQAFEDCGAQVDVLVNRGFPGDLAEAHRFHPVFSCGAYDHPLGHGRWRDLVYLRAQSRVFVEELDHGLRCVLNVQPVLVFSHTLADFELLGWGRYLGQKPYAGTLAVVERQTPGFRACGWVRRTLHPYWRLRPVAFRTLRRRLGDRFVLCTDSTPLSEDYAHVHAGRILTLPIPIAAAVWTPQAPGALAARYGLTDASRLRVGYVGDARAAKGFPLLPALVHAARAATLGVRFVIQCPRPGSGDDRAAPPAGLLELQELSRHESRDVVLIPESLTNEDYGDLLRHVDVIVLPYLHPSYREATSGIFAEAVALGTPVLVPSGTWMARELERAGAGVVVPRDRPEDLGAGLIDMVRRVAELRLVAQKTAESWRSFHSASTLARQLLEAAGVSATR